MKTTYQIGLAFEGDEIIVLSWSGIYKRLSPGETLRFDLKGKHVLDLKNPDVEKLPQSRAGEDKKVESDKKQEHGPKKICGACRHAPNSIVDFSRNQITLCEKKGRGVPLCFEGCPDFESHPAFSKPQSVYGEGEVDISVYIERIDQLEKDVSKAQASRHEAVGKYSALVDKYSALVDKHSDGSDEYSRATNDLKLFVEGYLYFKQKSVALEKDNAKLQSTNAHLKNELEAAIRKVDSANQIIRELEEAERRCPPPPSYTFFM